jgi:hypothetical protein
MFPSNWIMFTGRIHLHLSTKSMMHPLPSFGGNKKNISYAFSSKDIYVFRSLATTTLRLHLRIAWMAVILPLHVKPKNESKEMSLFQSLKKTYTEPINGIAFTKWISNCYLFVVNKRNYLVAAICTNHQSDDSNPFAHDVSVFCYSNLLPDLP